jgi:hypothetical protein
MNDVLNDIQVLENAIIAFTEGASDEKFAAMCSLEQMLITKKDIVSDFEAEYAPNE